MSAASKPEPLKLIERSADQQREAIDFSDEDITQVFVERYGNQLRHVAAGGIGWLIWDGRRWARDRKKRVWALAREHCDRIAEEADRAIARDIKSRRTIAAVESLARHDRAIAAAMDEFDAHPWLLNTPAGVIDLTTGEIRPHDPSLMLSQMTSVAPGGDCPTWLRFLGQVTGGDADFEAFLRRVAGYALTGSTREHGVFFIFGPGANGKTTFVNALANVLADYHCTAPIETFVAVAGGRQTNDIASLAGSRFVTSTETEPDRKWAETRLKLLSGGDEVSVRAMYEDFFSYVPTFKLLVAGNNKPGLTGVDEAIRRRLHIIPFTEIIAASDRDLQLPEKLKAEAGGILAWMLAGCREWQGQGLNPPQIVVSASEDYFADEDVMSTWLARRCEQNQGSFTSSTQLYNSFCQVVKEHGELAWTMKSFSMRLESRGYQKMATRDGKGFIGLRLRKD